MQPLTCQCRPTYMTLPTDLFDQEISASSLDKPLPYKSIKDACRDLSMGPKAEEHIVKDIVNLYKAAQNPCILVSNI
jgi:pyruvate decarboxylase